MQSTLVCVTIIVVYNPYTTPKPLVSVIDVISLAFSYTRTITTVEGRSKAGGEEGVSHCKKK